MNKEVNLSDAIAIATYLKWTKNPEAIKLNDLSGSTNYWIPSKEASGILEETLYVPEAFGFHYDWNWLMLLVGAIERDGYEVIIAESRTTIKHNTDQSTDEVVLIDSTSTKIYACYKACLEFVHLELKTTAKQEEARDFEEYKMIHNFTFPEEPLKEWVNVDTYNNIFKTDTDSLLTVLDVIDDTWAFAIIISKSPSDKRHLTEIVYTNPNKGPKAGHKIEGISDTRKGSIYNAIVNLVKSIQ